MKGIALLSAAACLSAGFAMAQTARPNNAKIPPSPATTNQSTTDHNPAVATTSNANDSATPATGSNSFTENQARSRIGDRGYGNVSDLKKGDDGVWRGTAQHGAQSVQVWLDYKGNVGEMH